MVGLMQIKVQATWRLMVTRLISLIPCLTLAVVFEATNTFDQVRGGSTPVCLLMALKCLPCCHTMGFL